MPDDKNKPQTGQPAEPPSQPSSPPQEDDSLDASKAGPASTPPPTEPQQANDPFVQATKKNLPGKAFVFGNLYLIVFALLVLIAGVVVYVSIKTGAPKNNDSHAGSLTDQQLSTLKGNTTLVGDSKNTLDVQSNSIFEGQVLLRSDLNVAGNLKVGGPLSLPSITVGGSGTFGQIGISGGLNVSKDTVIQGQLTVKNNLSVSGTANFGALDVSTLSVTKLNIRGDLAFNQHLVSSGGGPGRTGGTALGGGGTVSVSGTDTAGSINVNTGSGAPAGCFVTVSFTHQFSSTPYVVISPANSNAATIEYYVTNRSSGGFSVCSANAPGNGKNFVYNYVVIQ